MEKSLCIGVAIGMIAGALLAVNSCKVRKLVCAGQRQMKNTVEKIAEEKRDNEQETEE
ncbi:MAG: hypothetical protein IJV67_04360 [Clostridia bacterium]|nr:hypothetical protein [Clostridia bacterium]MBR2969371.1 hypothetical protein [Clostridia bacterium]